VKLIVFKKIGIKAKGVRLKLPDFGPSDESFFMQVFFMILDVLNSKKAKLKKSYGEKVLKIAKTKKKL